MTKRFRLFSFDKGDSTLYGLEWLPSVNRRLSLNENTPVAWDFYFIGKDKGRGEFLKRLENRLKEWGFRTQFLIVEKKSDAVPIEEALRQANASACIVDIVASGQEGMSLRPLDALFLGKKLLTNNANVAEMDFYNPSNVYILRDLQLDGLKEWMRSPFQKMEDERVSKYEINHWLQERFVR